MIPFIYAVPSPDLGSTPEVYVIEITHNAIRIIDTYDGTIITPTFTAGYITAAAYAYTSVPEKIQYAQSADVMWLVHPDVAPLKVTRTAAQTFTITRWDHSAAATTSIYTVKQHPFFDVNITATQLSLNNVSNAVGTTVTIGSSTAGTFNAGHVGAFFKLTKASKTGVVRVTAFVNGAEVTGVIWNELEATLMNSFTSDWEEGAWSTYRGWPRAVCFYQGRLWMGGTSSKPDMFWGSKVENYDHFMARHFSQDSSANTSGINYVGSAVNDDPVSFICSSRQVNQIQWMDSKRSLLIGTSGSEFEVLGPDTSQSLGADNVGVRENSTNGSMGGQASKLASAIAFAGRDARSIRKLEYEATKDSFESENLIEYASHLVDAGDLFGIPGTIVQTVWQDSMDTLWCRTRNGYLFGVTTNPKTKVTAAFPVELGGIYNPFDGGSFHAPGSYAKDITGATQANPVVITCAGHGFVNNEFVRLESLGGMTQVNNLTFRATDVTADTFSLAGIDGSAYSAYTSGGTVRKQVYSLPRVTGMCVVPSTNGQGDDLWLAVQRWVNNAAICYVERMHPDWRWTALTDWKQYADTYARGLPYFSDSSKYYEAAKSVEGITKANPGVVTSTAHGYSNGDQVRLVDVLGMTQVNGLVFTVANKTNDTYELSGVNTSGYGAWAVGGRSLKLVTSATGFNHLIGEVVTVLADAEPIGYKTVDGSGNIALGGSYSTVIAGLPYVNRIKTQRLDGGASIGSALGLVKQINRASMNFFRTLYAKFGTSLSNLQEINFAPGDLLAGEPIPAFTGEKVEIVPDSPDREKAFIIECDQPVPFTLVSLALKGSVSDS